MTEEFYEKMGWEEEYSEAFPEEPPTEEELKEMAESLPPGFWSNPNYLGGGN